MHTARGDKGSKILVHNPTSDILKLLKNGELIGKGHGIPSGNWDYVEFYLRGYHNYTIVITRNLGPWPR